MWHLGPELEVRLFSKVNHPPLALKHSLTSLDFHNREKISHFDHERIPVLMFLVHRAYALADL
jgi:catalase